MGTTHVPDWPRGALLVVILWLSACDVPAAAGSDPGRGAGDNPFRRHALTAAARFAFGGRVQERLPAGGYLYLRVRDATGRDHWVATLRAFAPASRQVRVWVMARADRFRSRRLARDFAPLLFASVRPGRAQQPAANKTVDRERTTDGKEYRREPSFAHDPLFAVPRLCGLRLW